MSQPKGAYNGLGFWPDRPGACGFIVELWIDYQKQADRLISAIELTQRQTADQRQRIERVRQLEARMEKICRAAQKRSQEQEPQGL